MPRFRVIGDFIFSYLPLSYTFSTVCIKCMVFKIEIRIEIEYEHSKAQFYL